MNEDELRNRLRRIDPAPTEVALEPPTTPSSRDRLERIMSTRPPFPSPPPDQDATPRPTRSRWLLAGAAAVVAVAGLVAVTLAGGDDGDTGPPLELSLGASDTMASCLAVDAEILAAMPVAFGGTATEVAGEDVTLEVDRWYGGGDADTVRLRAASGQEALIDGFELEVGERYLISASEGAVSFCGFSGPATPELTALYDEAFPG